MKMELCVGSFEELSNDDQLLLEGGGLLSSILIGAVVGAASTVALALSCGLIAPTVILGVQVSAKAVAVGYGVVGAVGGGAGGAIKGALND